MVLRAAGTQITTASKKHLFSRKTRLRSAANPDSGGKLERNFVISYKD